IVSFRIIGFDLNGAAELLLGLCHVSRLAPEQAELIMCPRVLRILWQSFLGPRNRAIELAVLREFCRGPQLAILRLNGRSGKQSENKKSKHAVSTDRGYYDIICPSKR